MPEQTNTHPNEQNLTGTDIKPGYVRLAFDLTTEQIEQLCDVEPLKRALESSGFNVSVIGLGVIFVYDADVTSSETLFDEVLNLENDQR